MNLFLILIPQSLNSQCLNLPQHSHYEEAGVQKADLFFRSNNDVCNEKIHLFLTQYPFPAINLTFQAIFNI